MQTNRHIAIFSFVILLMTIGAVMVFGPKPKPSPLAPIFNNPVQQQSMMIYFSKSKGSETVTEAVSRPLPKAPPKSAQGMVKAALTELLTGPTAAEKDAGYFSEIPAGTKILAVRESPKAIIVDLSGTFTSGGGSNSMLQRLQEVTKTVASVPQRKPVYLHVDGKQLDVLGGEGVIVDEPITNDPSVSQ